LSMSYFPRVWHFYLDLFFVAFKFKSSLSPDV